MFKYDMYKYDINDVKTNFRSLNYYNKTKIEVKTKMIVLDDKKNILKLYLTRF